MKKLVRPKRIILVALGALAIMLAVSAPGQAAGLGSQHVEGGHGGGAVGGHGFEGNHFEGNHFEGHHFEPRPFEGHRFEGHRFEAHHFGFWPVYPYYPPDYEAPSYWYYCPSYNAYYPNVTSCPEAWEPVPAE